MAIALEKEVRKAGEHRYYISIPKVLITSKALKLKKKYKVTIKEIKTE